MAETIFSRISRLVSATVEDSVDRLERSGGDAVMREAIREVDRAIDAKKAERDAVTARRLQSVRQSKLSVERIEALAGKARFAVEAGRDELAEAVLSQQLDCEAQLGRFESAIAQARDDEARLDEALAALKARKAQMEESLAAYMAARRDAPAGSPPPDRSTDRAVEAAERAFERAMSGDVGLASTDATTVSRVAEVEVLQRTAAIAERLASLKAGRAA